MYRTSEGAGPCRDRLGLAGFRRPGTCGHTQGQQGAGEGGFDGRLTEGDFLVSFKHLLPQQRIKWHITLHVASIKNVHMTLADLRKLRLCEVCTYLGLCGAPPQRVADELRHHQAQGQQRHYPLHRDTKNE